jgi:uncharacterized Zn finger protein (UPF0148 family)
VALNRIQCPECGAGLKSASGFTAGESVECPKCETYFTVELPDEDEDDVRPAKKKAKAVATRSHDDDDDEDEKPRKKKKKKSSRDDDDDDRSYKNSPVRYVILGILVVVMVVLGIMLVMKMQREKADPGPTANSDNTPPRTDGQPRIDGQPQVPNGIQPKMPNPGQPGNPALPMNPRFPMNPNLPKNPGFPNPQPNPDDMGGLFGTPPSAGSAESIRIMDALSKKLTGAWEGTAPNGEVHKVTYQASGQFTHDVNGKPTNGTWQATGLVGTKVLKITRGGKVLRMAFEGDDLLHDTGTGESVVLKKK